MRLIRLRLSMLHSRADTARPRPAESWVTKGPKQLKRMEPRGRGHFGVRVHPDSRLHVILKEGKTVAELKEDERKKQLKRIVSAGLIREDVPLRNPSPSWAW